MFSLTNDETGAVTPAQVQGKGPDGRGLIHVDAGMNFDFEAQEDGSFTVTPTINGNYNVGSGAHEFIHLAIEDIGSDVSKLSGSLTGTQYQNLLNTISRELDTPRSDLRFENKEWGHNEMMTQYLSLVWTSNFAADNPGSMMFDSSAPVIEDLAERTLNQDSDSFLKTMDYLNDLDSSEEGQRHLMTKVVEFGQWMNQGRDDQNQEDLFLNLASRGRDRISRSVARLMRAPKIPNDRLSMAIGNTGGPPTTSRMTPIGGYEVVVDPSSNLDTADFEYSFAYELALATVHNNRSGRNFAGRNLTHLGIDAPEIHALAHKVTLQHMKPRATDIFPTSKSKRAKARSAEAKQIRDVLKRLGVTSASQLRGVGRGPLDDASLLNFAETVYPGTGRTAGPSGSGAGTTGSGASSSPLATPTAFTAPVTAQPSFVRKMPIALSPPPPDDDIPDPIRYTSLSMPQYSPDGMVPSMSRISAPRPGPSSIDVALRTPNTMPQPPPVGSSPVARLDLVPQQFTRPERPTATSPQRLTFSQPQLPTPQPSSQSIITLPASKSSLPIRRSLGMQPTPSSLAKFSVATPAIGMPVTQSSPMPSFSIPEARQFSRTQTSLADPQRFISSSPALPAAQPKALELSLPAPVDIAVQSPTRAPLTRTNIKPLDINVAVPSTLPQTSSPSVAGLNLVPQKFSRTQTPLADPKRFISSSPTIPVPQLQALDLSLPTRVDMAVTQLPTKIDLARISIPRLDVAVASPAMPSIIASMADNQLPMFSIPQIGTQAGLGLRQTLLPSTEPDFGFGSFGAWDTTFKDAERRMAQLRSELQRADTFRQLRHDFAQLSRDSKVRAQELKRVASALSIDMNDITINPASNGLVSIAMPQVGVEITGRLPVVGNDRAFTITEVKASSPMALATAIESLPFKSVHTADIRGGLRLDDTNSNLIAGLKTIEGHSLQVGISPVRSKEFGRHHSDIFNPGADLTSRPAQQLQSNIRAAQIQSIQTLEFVRAQTQTQRPSDLRMVSSPAVTELASTGMPMQTIISSDLGQFHELTRLTMSRLGLVTQPNGSDVWMGIGSVPRASNIEGIESEMHWRADFMPRQDSFIETVQRLVPVVSQHPGIHLTFLQATDMFYHPSKRAPIVAYAENEAMLLKFLQDLNRDSGYREFSQLASMPLARRQFAAPYEYDLLDAGGQPVEHRVDPLVSYGEGYAEVRQEIERMIAASGQLTPSGVRGLEVGPGRWLHLTGEHSHQISLSGTHAPESVREGLTTIHDIPSLPAESTFAQLPPLGNISAPPSLRQRIVDRSKLLLGQGLQGLRGLSLMKDSPLAPLVSTGFKLLTRGVDALERVRGLKSREDRFTFSHTLSDGTQVSQEIMPYRPIKTALQPVDLSSGRQRVGELVVNKLRTQDSVVLYIGGRALTGKTSLAYDIAGRGIAGIPSSDINVISADYLNENNHPFGLLSRGRHKLIIIEGQGIPSPTSVLGKMVDVGVFLSMDEQKRFGRRFSSARGSEQQVVHELARLDPLDNIFARYYIDRSIRHADVVIDTSMATSSPLSPLAAPEISRIPGLAKVSSPAIPELAPISLPRMSELKVSSPSELPYLDSARGTIMSSDWFGEGEAPANMREEALISWQELERVSEQYRTRPSYPRLENVALRMRPISDPSVDKIAELYDTNTGDVLAMTKILPGSAGALSVGDITALKRGVGAGQELVHRLLESEGVSRIYSVNLSTDQEKSVSEDWWKTTARMHASRDFMVEPMGLITRGNDMSVLPGRSDDIRFEGFGKDTIVPVVAIELASSPATPELAPTRMPSVPELKIFSPAVPGLKVSSPAGTLSMDIFRVDPIALIPDVDESSRMRAAEMGLGEEILIRQVKRSHLEEVFSTTLSDPRVLDFLNEQRPAEFTLLNPARGVSAVFSLGNGLVAKFDFARGRRLEELLAINSLPTHVDFVNRPVVPRRVFNNDLVVSIEPQLDTRSITLAHARDVEARARVQGYGLEDIKLDNIGLLELPDGTQRPVWLDWDYVDLRSKTVSSPSEAPLIVDQFFKDKLQHSLLESPRFRNDTLLPFAPAGHVQSIKRALTAIERVGQLVGDPITKTNTLGSVMNIINTQPEFSRIDPYDGIEAIEGIAAAIARDIDSGALTPQLVREQGITTTFRNRAAQVVDMRDMLQLAREARASSPTVPELAPVNIASMPALKTSSPLSRQETYRQVALASREFQHQDEKDLGRDRLIFTKKLITELGLSERAVVMIGKFPSGINHSWILTQDLHIIDLNARLHPTLPDGLKPGFEDGGLLVLDMQSPEFSKFRDHYIAGIPINEGGSTAGSELRSFETTQRIVTGDRFFKESLARLRQELKLASSPALSQAIFQQSRDMLVPIQHGADLAPQIHRATKLDLLKRVFETGQSDPEVLKFLNRFEPTEFRLLNPAEGLTADFSIGNGRIASFDFASGPKLEALRSNPSLEIGTFSRNLLVAIRPAEVVSSPVQGLDRAKIKVRLLD
ncbi:hypothetical protein ACFL96_16170, partial [Thermoproteota archaeon]